MIVNQSSLDPIGFHGFPHYSSKLCYVPYYCFVKSSRTVVNSDSKDFEYHTDVLEDVEAAIFRLEELGYIEDITPGNCPMYRMTEEFVDRLKSE